VVMFPPDWKYTHSPLAHSKQTLARHRPSQSCMILCRSAFTCTHSCLSSHRGGSWRQVCQDGGLL